MYKLIQEAFRTQGIEFAHRNVTVYLPNETSPETTQEQPAEGPAPTDTLEKKIAKAGAAAVAASAATESSGSEPKDTR